MGRPDAAIEKVRHWRAFNYGPHLPAATVLAERDWLAYVQAMAASLPADSQLSFPDEQDVLWAWPHGVVVIFAEPIELTHTIVSRGVAHSSERLAVAPVAETQIAAGLVFFTKQPVPAEMADGAQVEPISAYPTLWIGEDASDIVQGNWVPGQRGIASKDTISESTRLLISIVTALGHRLTRLAEPGSTRGERRRAERALPGLRVLELATGASVQRTETTGTVAWQRRWMVRGHWRLQPHGPGRTLRKPLWIDPYVKGPEDKPLDVRPTIWRADV